MALYNEHAARGEDPLFRKRPEFLKPLDEPPFALIDCGTEAMYYAGMTLGGLRTRASGEVLSADDDPVPGLYAAGAHHGALLRPRLCGQWHLAGRRHLLRALGRAQRGGRGALSRAAPRGVRPCRWRRRSRRGSRPW